MNKKTAMLGILPAVLALAATAQLWHVDNSVVGNYNQTLTTFAVGIGQDALDNSLLNFIAPVVDTGGATQGQYKNYLTKEAFATYSTLLAGGNRTRVEFTETDPYFNVLPHGLETVTTAFQAQAGGSNVRQKKIKNLVNAAFRSREVRGWGEIRNAVTAVASRGNWSDAAVDPIGEIDEQIVAITDACGGMMPNAMVLPLAIWRTIRAHPLVKNRMTGTTREGLTLSQFASMLINPAIEIKLGTMSYENTPRGTAKSKASVYSADVWIFIQQPSPDEFDLSFFKTFSTSGGLVNGVQSYVEKGNVDVDFLDWSEQIVCTAPDAGRRLTIS